MKDSLTEHNTWGLERVHPEFILNIADALHSVADKSKELGGYMNENGENGANGANGANGDGDGLKVPELQVIPPDTSLMPERNDTEHRKLMSRKTQQQNIASLNVILSSSKTHETTSFVLDAVKDGLNNDKENEITVLDEKELEDINTRFSDQSLRNKIGEIFYISLYDFLSTSKIRCEEILIL